jgi:hypothetical protein
MAKLLIRIVLAFFLNQQQLKVVLKKGDQFMKELFLSEKN